MAKSEVLQSVINSIFIYPSGGNTLTGKLTDCYQQLTEGPLNKEIPRFSIVKQTIFISVQNNIEYLQSKQKLFACAKDYFDLMPPTSIIAQSPDAGELAIEIMYFEDLQANDISYRQDNNSASWMVIEKDHNKWLFATGFGEASESTDILKQSNMAFERLRNILKEEEMEFADIIRQWNYIEKITLNVTSDNSKSQHYQIFNDVRSRFYGQNIFINGFPAATGIGQDFGGIVIDIIACKIGDNGSILSVKSPVQLDAYQYSTEVLAENTLMRDFSKSTPKFERAKILISPWQKCLFVSGTAAIKGQDSIHAVSVEDQTEMTIQNILALISPENLKQQGINTNGTATLYFLRVYVKYQLDMGAVKSICKKYFPGIPVLYVKADICRPELLVEIEGQALFD